MHIDYNNNYKVGGVVRALLEGDVSGLGVGVLQPNIPADTDQSPIQEPAQSNRQVIANTPLAQNQENDLSIDQQIRGPEDPIKRFIDKLTDTKNKIFDEDSKIEIQKTINNVKI